MRQSKRISLEEMADAFARHGHRLTEEQLSRTREPISSLKIAPRVFQPRDMEEDSWVKERHINGLTKAVRTAMKLDPIVIFAVAGQRFVVDGHCRLEAYRRSGCNDDKRVPVRYLRGTFCDALRASVRANAKDKLPMTTAEKAEGAWRLVRHDESAEALSLREIASDSGVSRGLVANMRAILKDQKLRFDPRDMTWSEVKRETRSNVSFNEQWEEKTVNECAAKLRKACGKMPDRSPTLFLKAIEKAYPRAIEAMMEELSLTRAEELEERAGAVRFADIGGEIRR